MSFRYPGAFACSALLLGMLLLAGCGPATPPPAQLPPPPVQVRQPVVQDVVAPDDYEGRIAGSEVVEVRSRVRGHLQKIHFKDGQMVKKGDPLFDLDPRG